MASPFSADASALGYLYQTRYALLLLMKSDLDEELSIERYDDIAFSTTMHDPVELIQTKHHIKSDRSLSDASSDLWKTLRVWSESAAKGRIKLGKVKLTLITTSTADDDSAASLLCPPDNPAYRRDVNGAYEKLMSVIQKSKNERNREAYDTFSALGRDKQLTLLDSVIVLDKSPSIGDTKAKIIEQLRLSARREHRQLLFDRLQAWWFERVIQHLSGGRDDSITYREMDSVIHDLRDQFHQENLPIDYRTMPTPAETELKPTERIFIEQLRLVDVSEPRVKTAIGDYRKAYQQRSRWVREELVNIGELETYEGTLTDEWERQYNKMCEDIVKRQNNTEKKHKGKELFNWMEDKADYRIRPKVTERYVIRGSYHILANRLKVGWHQDYTILMQQAMPNISTEDLI